MFQNWFVLSYVGDYEFGSFAGIRLTVINKIMYLKPIPHLMGGPFACSKTIMFKVALFNSPQNILSLFSCVSNFTLLGFLLGTTTQNFSTRHLI